MPPIAHSKLGASSSKRWINCPGSIRLSEGIPKKSSVYADEGTAAHFLAEQCLRSGKGAAEFMDRNVAVPVDGEPKFVVGDRYGKEGLYGEGRVFEVTDNMVEAVQTYLDTIRSILSSHPGAELRIEHKFHLASLHEDLWGTCDCVIVLPFEKLIVLDYKHGQGVAVDAEENTQGMMYARGAAEGEDLEDIEIVIVQPRAPHREGPVRSWSISRTDLFNWAQDTLLPAALATEDPSAPLVAGHHCKFCPAGAICPEKRRETFEAASMAFDDGLFPVPVEKQPQLPDVRSLTPEQVTRILRLKPLALDFFKDVEEYARSGADTGRFTPGEDGFGFKLVQGKPGNRKYRDEQEAQTTLFSVLRKDANMVKTVSPAEAERRIKAGLAAGTVKEAWLKGMKPKEFVSQLTTRPDGAICLVPLDDPRPAIAAKTPEEAFDEAPWPAGPVAQPQALIEVNPEDF